MFWFKKKQLVLDCFTTNPSVYEFSKIQDAKHFIPDWWKETPKTLQHPATFFPKPTIKTCPGVIDLYKRGAIMPLWTDLAVEVGAKGESEYRWQFADTMSTAEVHPATQYNNYYHKYDYAHLKLNSPWLLRSNKEVYFAWTQPTYNMENLTEYVVLPGVCNHRYMSTSNINLFFIKKVETRTVMLDAGQPLVHLLPFSDENLTVVTHLITDEEAKRMVFRRRNFVSAYKENLKVTRCPFSTP